MAKQDSFVHWRDSARTPMFYTVDARASILVLLFFLRPSRYTFGAVVIAIIFLSILNYFKIPLMVAFRIFKGVLAGRIKHRFPRA